MGVRKADTDEGNGLQNQRSRGALSASVCAIRVCQPVPLAFQRARVSGSIRRLIATFALATTSRPRNFARKSAGKAESRWERAKSRSVQDGFSASVNSGLDRFFILFYLTFIGFAETDDADTSRRFTEHQHMQTITNVTKCLDALHWVFATIIRAEQCGLKVESQRQLERKAAFGNIALVLGRVVADFHQFPFYIRIY